MPKWSIAGRHYLPDKKINTPGPNVYKPEEVKISSKQAPRISMGIRYSEFCSTGHLSPDINAF